MDCERIKPNFSELERQTGISRQTLAKKWGKFSRSPTSGRKKRKRKYDAYEDQIRAVFVKTDNISAVYHYFKNQYPDVFTSYEGFRFFVLSTGITVKRKKKIHVRYETEFGEQVQVDWKEDIKAITSTGEIIVFNLYVLVFSASRKRFLCIAFQKTTEEFIRCAIETLQRAGGCPVSLLTDNMSAICNHQTGKLLETINEFLKDMGFDIRRCRVRSPQTKGKVESVNRFIQWLDPYQGTIKDIDDLYTKVSIIERQMNEETNDTTGFAPDILFPSDRKALQALPRQEIMDYWINARVVSVPATLLVNVNKGQYSVSKQYVGERITLVPCSKYLYIYKDLKVIRVHELDPNGGIHYDTKDYTEGLSESMIKVRPDLIAEQSRKNLEAISKMERRKNERKNSSGRPDDTEEKS